MREAAADREIERKFLVEGDAWRAGAVSLPCRQGYLAATADCTVRVRVIGTEAWLTIKGRTDGLGRAEYEYPIPVAHAEAMLADLCDPSAVIEKTRHIVWHAGRRWEVDEFAGRNRGLVVAEVELTSEHDVVELPPWAGREVSRDPRYRNASLARRPYADWSD